MMKRVSMDPKVDLQEQLASDEEGPLSLINVFTVDEADVDQLLKAWAIDSAHFKAQPGFISAQLHRGIAGSTTFVNVAVWENLASFRAAHGKKEFKEALAHYPDSATASPHLFRKIAVPNICVA